MKTNQKQKNIPDGWIQYMFSDVVNSILDFRGKTPLKIGMKWGDGNIKALSANNVKNGYIDFDSECHLASDELYKKWMNKGDLQKGDIVFTMEAPMGNVALIPDNKKYVLSQRVVAFKLNNEIVDNLFIYHYLRSIYFQSKLSLLATGSTAKGVNQKSLKRTNFNIPPLLEQNRIVTVLETWDETLEKIKKKISLKKEIKKGLMQELLTGKKRLPGFSGEWEEVKLECVIQKFSTGLNPRKNFKLGNGDNHYVTIKNINDGKLDFSKAEFIDDIALSQINKRSNLSKGDLIMSSIGNVGEAYLLKQDPCKWDINESVFSLKPDQDKLASDYLYYLITSENTKRYFENNITGSSFKSIKMKDLRIMKFLLPNLKEQKAIAEILTTADREIEELLRQQKLLEDQKKYLLNNLITGQIRTPENL